MLIAGSPRLFRHSQIIQECISRGVVRLAILAQYGRDRREQNEEIEIQVSGGLVQLKGAVNFRTQYTSERGGVEPKQELVFNNAGGVDDATDFGPAFGLECVEEMPQCTRLGNIERGNVHGCPKPLELTHKVNPRSSQMPGRD